MGKIHNAVPLSGGGNAALNFEMVSSTTEPTNPKENTIWVNTDIAIGEWQFSAIEPTTRADGSALVAGDVWIQISTSSAAAFNALKKQGLMIYPRDARQFDGSTWTKKEMLVFTNDEWSGCFPAPIVNGVIHTEVESHSIQSLSLTNSGGSPSFGGQIDTATGWTMSITSYHKYCCTLLTDAVDFTDISTMNVYGTLTAANSSRKYIPIFVFLVPSKETPLTVNDGVLSGAAVNKVLGSGVTSATSTWSIDVSALQGVYYIGALVAVFNIGGSASVTISNIDFD